MSKVFIRNDINHIINLPRKVKLRIITDYEAIRYFFINVSQHDLVMKALKRSSN